MAQFAGGRIEAFVGPTELGANDDLESVIVDFVGGADKTLDVAVQELSSEPIAQALIDARARGVSVNMVLEQDYLLSVDGPRTLTPAPGETAEDAAKRAQWTEEASDERVATSRRILAAMLRNGIDVRADYNKFIFHQKFVVRDYRGRATPTSALLTGSANFTQTDCHTNLNHIVVFHDVRIASQYAGEFAQLRAGQFGRLQHGDTPSTYNLDGVPVRVLFAPDHAPELEIMKQMLKAEHRIDFAVFTFAGSSGIDDAMLVVAAAGRTVRGVLDPGQGAQAWAATRWLAGKPNIELLVPKRIRGFRKLHHKLMVIDDHTVVAGSMNYTAPANLVNDENIFVIGSPYADLPAREGGPVDLAKCAEITRYFRTEIDRIASVSDPYRPPT
jgi:phosphatidylserine/phosphatidylglycerophosphate/cardiolipin synthase-like enzyme